MLSNELLSCTFFETITCETPVDRSQSDFEKKCLYSQERHGMFLTLLDSQRPELYTILLTLLSPIELNVSIFISGSVLLFGMWAFSPKTMLPMYLSVGTAISFGWVLQLNYWMYQNEADGICDTWWDEREAPWWTGSLFTIVIQLLYILYLNQKFYKCANLQTGEACITGATIVPHLFCMTTIFIGVSAPIFYWLTKIVFIVIAFGQVVYYYSNSGLPLRKLTQEELKQLNPGKWFMRDLLVAFTLVYYCLCVLTDAVGSCPVRIFSVSYLTTFLGDWCTSLVIVIGLSACFGFLSNLLVALSRYLITGQKAFAAAVFDINIGGRVNLAMTLFFLEAGIVTAEDELRIQNFKIVLFLTFYVILAQVWDMTEQQCHIVANSGESHTGLAYLRVLLFAGTITAVPTIVTFRAATYLELDVWMLLNASGTIVILCRAVCSLVELALGSVAWHVDSHLDKVEDLIYFTRLVRNLLTAVTSLMLAYYRLFAPFFTGLFLFRLFLVVCEVFGVANLIVYKEWIVFQNRRTFLKRLDTIPDATEEQLRELNDVCSICFAEMDAGKVLHCSHIFHTACLRKWFQLRSTCPLCNVAAF